VVAVVDWIVDWIELINPDNNAKIGLRHEKIINGAPIIVAINAPPGIMHATPATIIDIIPNILFFLLSFFIIIFFLIFLY
jgi:hypothetical protein